MLPINRNIIGGNSEVLAMPYLNANKEILNPDKASVAKFSFNPVKPSFGILFF